MPARGPASPDRSGWLVGGRIGRPHGLDGSFYVTRARPALLAVGGVVRVGKRDAEIVRRAARIVDASPEAAAYTPGATL